MPDLCSLKRRSEFLAAAQSGKKWVAPGLIMQLGERTTSGNHSSIRYGLTASGKIGNAVRRNRARRRLRALAHEILPQHATPEYDYVVIARAATVTREYAALKQDFITALKKLGAYCEENT